MNEGQFKHIEDKIKEAAERTQPAFDEHAWEKMEMLLDRKKGKKRPFIWWPIAILIIAGFAIFQLNQSSSLDKSELKKSNRNNAEADIIMKAIDSANNKSVVTPNIFISEKTREQQKNKAALDRQTNKIAASQTTFFEPKKDGFENVPAKIVEAKNTANSDASANPGPGSINEPNENHTDTEDKIEEFKKEKNNNTLQKNPATSKREIKNRLSKSFAYKIYLTASAGIDGSGSRLFSYTGSSISPKFGLGLGYQFHKRLSLETGFYLGAKKYTAGPRDYKYSMDSYWNTVDLLKVDADCFVYEIPLLLRYDILQKPNTSYYASGGLVSFIMKSEDYIYNYLKNGNSYSSARSYKGNSHFLSSFQFSVGVEKKLSEKLSIQFTPSVTIPIAGIGNGKVKVYSTSLQAGIKYHPFRKK